MAAAHRHAAAHPAPSSAPLAAAPASALAIRPVATLAEYRACVALQHDVWGPDFESVPASMLQVATYTGGLCLGAFAPDDELYGFVFSLAGAQDGMPIHWSHLLAVRTTARDLGVGRQLKERQRRILADRGVLQMRWSFDPLIAKNAHLNLNLLGAQVVRYVPDMYGTTQSPLHHGLATDRLVVSCSTATRDVGGIPSRRATAPVLTPAPQPGDDILTLEGDAPPDVWIEVPVDFQRLIEQTPSTAVAWHDALRRHFRWALSRGYRVTGLHRDAASVRSYYTLEAR